MLSIHYLIELSSLSSSSSYLVIGNSDVLGVSLNLLKNSRKTKLVKYRTVIRSVDWGDLDVDGWIILGRNSERWDVGIWTGLGWPRIETGGGRL